MVLKHRHKYWGIVNIYLGTSINALKRKKENEHTMMKTEKEKPKYFGIILFNFF